MVSESEQYRFYKILQQLHQVRWTSLLQEMTHLEYMMMSAIANHQLMHPDSAGIYVSALAKELSVSVSMVSKLLGTLEKKGWIRRETDPASRRNTFVSMTEAGAAVFQEELGRNVAANEQVFEKMGHEAIERFLTDAERLASYYAEVIGTE